MKSLGPEPVCAHADGSPGKLALDAALEEHRLQPFAAGSNWLITRVALASNRGTEPTSKAIEFYIQPGRDRVRRLLIDSSHEDTEPLKVGP